MTLEQLRVFVAVAERQHVTRAAEALNLSQSTVSNAIAALEVRHGTLLFNRVGRRIELTEAGRLFLGEARAVLLRADTAELALADLASLRRGKLNVQASRTIASYWLPRHLVAFHGCHPGVAIKLTVGNTLQVATAVHAGDVELGFVEGAVEDPMLEATILATDQIVLLVSPEHPLAGRSDVSEDQLMATNWVMREAGSGTRSEFETAMNGLGVPVGALSVVMELPTNGSVRAATEAGLGITALSASVAAPSLEAGLLVQVAFSLPSRNFLSVRHRERALSQASQSLLGLISAGRCLKRK